MQSFHPTAFHPTASLQRLRQRSALLTELRQFFLTRGFWEVETPVLAAEAVVDRYLDPIPTVWPIGSGTERSAWLQTSPELHMKRLVAAGADAIFQITRAFRRDESGPLHNPEFTMVEWYRVADSLESGIELLADLCDTMLSLGLPTAISYHDAFQQTLGIDPHRATATELAAAARARGVAIPKSLREDPEVDAWLNLLMSECVEPHLADQPQPCILYHYPASQAALAKLTPRDDDPSILVAERFELYAGGVELANGYHELQDADALAERQQLANQQRQEDGKARLPEPSQLLAAMRHGLPACVGVALGFDRLAMLALNARCIQDVLAFPWVEKSPG